VTAGDLGPGFDLEISAAAESDVPGLVETAALSWREGFSNFLGPEDIERYVEASFSSEAFRKRMEDPTQEWVLARDAGEVVGFASFGDRGMGPELMLLYVRPSHWRLGVGRRLLASIEDHARSRGIVRYRALAHRRNERGVAFYEGQGFSREDAPDRHDHWAMMKRLE